MCGRSLALFARRVRPPSLCVLGIRKIFIPYAGWKTPHTVRIRVVLCGRFFTRVVLTHVPPHIAVRPDGRSHRPGGGGPEPLPEESPWRPLCRCLAGLMTSHGNHELGLLWRLSPLLRSRSLFSKDYLTKSGRNKT